MSLIHLAGGKLETSIYPEGEVDRAEVLADGQVIAVSVDVDVEAEGFGECEFVKYLTIMVSLQDRMLEYLRYDSLSQFCKEDKSPEAVPVGSHA